MKKSRPFSSLVILMRVKRGKHCWGVACLWLEKTFAYCSSCYLFYGLISPWNMSSSYLLSLRWRLCYRLTCVEFLDVVSGILQIVEHVRRGAHCLKNSKQLARVFFISKTGFIFVKFLMPFFLNRRNKV